MDGFLVVASGVYGLCLGSFLNVVIHRLPREVSLLKPRSRCPRCRRKLRWRDNIPVLSFLFLRGKCAFCRRPISWRYPLVEIATGALSASLAWRWSPDKLWVAVAALGAGALFAMAVIDWDTFLIPDELSIGFGVLGLAFCWRNPYFSGGWEALGSSILGAAIGFGVAYALAWFGEIAFKKEALGGGDIKLLASVGAWAGGQGALSTLMLGSFFGTFYAMALLLKKKAKRGDAIPFGPFLALGAMVNLFERITLDYFILL